MPGPPPVITAKSARASAPPSSRPSAYSGWSRGVRAEPNTVTARGQLREHPEALDELGLDAQHPPRVGVHPVAVPAGVEQPLVGGARLVALLPAQHHRTALLLLLPGPLAAGPFHATVVRGVTVVHVVTVVRAPVTVGDARVSPEETAQDVRASGDLPDVDVLLAGVGEVRVAGAVVQGGDAERGEPGRRRSSRTWRARSCPSRRGTPAAAGAARPGRAPGAESVTVDVEPVEHLADVLRGRRRRCGRARTGS